MKKYIPFPIDLSAYPEVDELTCSQYGILRLIIEGFWKTGREIPKNDYTLYHSLRCDYKLWSRAKGAVYKALNVVLPDVIEARNKKIVIRQKFSENAIKTNAKTRLAKRDNNKTFCEKDEVKKLIITAVPKTHEETAWNKGQFDPVMRKIALLNNKENKGVKKVFFDKPKD